MDEDNRMSHVLETVWTSSRNPVSSVNQRVYVRGGDLVAEVVLDRFHVKSDKKERARE